MASGPADWTTMYWYMGVNPNYIGDSFEDKGKLHNSKKTRKAPELADNQATLDRIGEENK